LRALEAVGFEVVPGEEVTEKARSIKGPDEILAMRAACYSCEQSVLKMEHFARENIPNGEISENEVWAVLHAENIKRGGEWIETRL
jgi:Xaa-Pro aminopeptidase